MAASPPTLTLYLSLLCHICLRCSLTFQIVISLFSFGGTKGDEHLDMVQRTFGHHQDEALGELCYYMYEARRAPLSTLRRAVRSNFVAAHYPPTVARLVEWTSDEASPAFYT